MNNEKQTVETKLDSTMKSEVFTQSITKILSDQTLPIRKLKLKFILQFHPRGKIVLNDREDLLSTYDTRKRKRVVDWQYVDQIFNSILQSIDPESLKFSTYTGNVEEDILTILLHLYNLPPYSIFVNLGNHLCSLSGEHDVVQSAKILRLLSDDDSIAIAYIRGLFERVMRDNVTKLNSLSNKSAELIQWLSRAPSNDCSNERFIKKFIYYLPGYKVDFSND